MDELIKKHLAEKISAETKYLQKRTELFEADLNDRKEEPRWYDNFFAFQGWGWLGIILTLAITSFGFYQTLEDYFDKESSRNAFELDTDIITMTAASNSKTPSERSKLVNLLSYYEFNSLPVIVYFLERETNDTVRKDIKKSLVRIILHATEKEKIIAEVTSSFEIYSTMINPGDEANFYNFKTYLNIFKDDIFKSVATEEQRNKIISILEKVRTEYSQDSATSIAYRRYLKELEDDDIKKFK